MRQIDKLHRLLVIVEGPDGAGKTTFIEELRRLFDYQVYSFDRFGPGSCFVFDELFKRPVELRRNYVAELQLLERAFDVRQVILFATPLVLQRRIQARDQPPDEGEASVDLLKQQVTLFNQWAVLTKRFVPTLQLHTDTKTAKETAEEVYAWLIATLDWRPVVS